MAKIAQISTNSVRVVRGFSLFYGSLSMGDSGACGRVRGLWRGAADGGERKPHRFRHDPGVRPRNPYRNRFMRPVAHFAPVGAKQKTRNRLRRLKKYWLGGQDSNLRMRDPKSRQVAYFASLIDLYCAIKWRPYAISHNMVS